MKVVYTQEALADLDAILEFSARLSSLGRSDADVDYGSATKTGI
jgi:hypothetical protein